MLLNKEQIKEIIPYDEPFLWVDEVESIENDAIIGYKQTLAEDPYFKGHFLEFPIMPGVLVMTFKKSARYLIESHCIVVKESVIPGYLNWKTTISSCCRIFWRSRTEHLIFPQVFPHGWPF